MAVQRLTDEVIRKLTPKNNKDGKLIPHEVRDTVVPGLVVRAQPGSGRKLYYAEYRWLVIDPETGQRRKKPTRKCLGRSDHLSLADARRSAQKVINAAREAADFGYTGKRVKDHIAKALLGIDRSVDEIEAEAAKQDQCPTVEEFIDKTHGPSLESRKKYARNGRETIRLKFLLGLYQSESGLDLLSMKVNAVDYGKIDDWRIKRSQTILKSTGEKPASSTIQRDLASISGLFKTAIKRKLITTNPVAEVDHEASENQIVRYLGSNDPGEEQRLLKALIDREAAKRKKRISSNRWAGERGYKIRPEYPENKYVDYLRPMVMLAMHTGLRRGELFALQWKHVTFRNSKTGEIKNSIKVPGRLTKNKKPHYVPLNDVAALVLRKWRNQRATIDQNAYVFPGKKGRQLYDIRRPWKSVLEIAGIRDFRFHDLRHHFASSLAIAKVSLYTIAELMNHQDMKMTRRYAHLSEGHMSDAVGELAKDMEKWNI